MKLVFDLKEYVSPSHETSHYKGIPMEYLDITRKILKSKGYTCKVRYRGSRSNPQDTRHWFNKKSTCLKAFANTFTVYSN